MRLIKLFSVVIAFVMLCPTVLNFNVKAATENQYPICYGKFITRENEMMYLPVIVRKNTVYVNVWDFSSMLNYSVDSYQDYLDEFNSSLLKKLKSEKITSSFYARAATSIADEASANVDSVKDEWSIFSDIVGFIDKSVDNMIDNAISEANDTYYLERSDTQSYGGITWYIDVGSKKVSARSENKTIVTYTLDAEILSTPPEKANNNDMDDIWIPFDALCQMFGCSWYISDEAICLGTVMPYVEEFIFNDYSDFACNPDDLVSGYSSMSGMSNLLDTISDGLDAISGFNFKAIDKLCEGVTADEYDYLANAILYLDPQETKELRSLSETMVYEQLPVLNSLIGDEHVQNLFSQTSKVDYDELKVSLKVSDETLNAVKTNSELLSIATQSSRLLLDCMLTYDHMAHLNEDGLDSLNDYFSIYQREYCDACEYCSQIIIVAPSDIPQHKLEQLENQFNKREIWFFNKKKNEYYPEINCKNGCGNIPCNFMRNMQEMTALYDDVDWKEDYIEYVTTSLANETVSFTLSNILDVLAPVKYFSVLNTGWQCMTELVNGGTGVMDYYEAVGYIGPAYMLESDSLYFLKKYSSNYKVGGNLDKLKSLTYINLKSYYIANSELDAILSNSLNSKVRTYDFAKIRAQSLSSILAKLMLADYMPVEYEKPSRMIIESDAFYQKVTGAVLTENNNGNSEPVKRANVVFTKEEKEYVFTTDSNGKMIDKANNEKVYLPKGSYAMTITANGYENYEDDVIIVLTETCDLEEIFLEMGERMPMIANFHIGSNFSNIFNGGFITESSKYVYYCPSSGCYTYRYEKSNSNVMRLSKHGGNCLNISSDEYLYVVERDNEIWEINGITGETRLVLRAADWGEKYLYGCRIQEIQSMLLIDDDLYVLFTGYRRDNTSEETAVLVALNRDSAKIKSTIQWWSGGRDYGDHMHLKFSFVAAEGDLVYYTWQQDDGQLKLYNCNVTDYCINDKFMYSEKGGELNASRDYNVTGFGNGYTYDVGQYDVEFWDAVSEGALYSFNRTWYYGKYTVYDFFTDCYYEPEDPYEAINGGNRDSIWAHKTVFINGSLYILTSDNDIYRISEDLSEGEAFYSMKNEVDVYDDKIGFTDWEYGVADNAIWLLYSGNTLRLSLEGKHSYMDTENAKQVENPYDTNIYGNVASCLMGKTGLYATPDVGANLRIMSVNSGTRCVLLSKVVSDGGETEYYKVRLEDGTEGYMLKSSIYVSEESDAVLEVED